MSQARRTSERSAKSAAMDPVTGDFEAYLADFDEAVRGAHTDLGELTLHPGETIDAETPGRFRGRSRSGSSS